MNRRNNISSHATLDLQRDDFLVRKSSLRCDTNQEPFVKSASVQNVIERSIDIYGMVMSCHVCEKTFQKIVYLYQD